MKGTAQERIATGVAQLTISKVLLKVFSVSGFFIIVANLSVKDYGLLGLLFSVLSPATVLSMLGLERLVTADVAFARGKQQFSYARQLLLDYLKLSGILVTALFIIGWIARGFIDRFYEADINYFFWSLVVLIVGQLGMNFTSITFESHERFGLAAWLHFGESGLRFLFLVSLFFIGFSLPTLLWTYIFSKVGITLLLLPALLKTLSVPEYQPEPRNLIFDVLKRHGKWATVRNTMSIGLDSLGPWFINFFVSTEAVALFSFAQKIYSTVTTAIPLKSIIFPVIANSIGKSRDVARIIITKAQKILFYGYIPIGLGLVFLTDPLIGVFFPEYSGATVLLQLMAFHLVIEVYSVGQADVLYALKQQRPLFNLTMIIIFIRFVTQALFIFWFGVIGMIISWLVTSAASAFLRERILITKVNFPIWNSRAFFTFDDYDKIIIQMVLQKIRRVAPFK